VSGVEPGERAGWQVLRLVTDELAVEVVPGLGGTVTSLRRRSDDAEVLGRTPWGLRHRDAARLPGTGETAMLDLDPGGWRTVFPNGADAVTVAGADWPAGGEARAAWFDWRPSGSSVVLTTRLVRSPFELTKIISMSRNTVTLGETVKNVGGEHSDVIWGQSVLLGADLLGPSTVVDTAASLVRPDPRTADNAGYDDLLPWPRGYAASDVVNLRTVPPPGAGQARTAYLTDLGSATASVRNPAHNLRVDLEWDATAWPYLWYALDAGGGGGHPWYRSGYGLTLTPATSWPDRGIHEVRRVSATSLRIHPGVTRTSFLTLTVS
jgi:hypothetical protein